MSANRNCAPGTLELPDEIAAELEKFSALATIRTADGASEFFRDALNVEVTKYAIVSAVQKRQIQHVKRAGSLYFSPRALVRWLMEGLRTEIAS